MGVACETPAAATGRLVRELKAKSEEKREHALDKRLGVAHEGTLGGLIVEVDGDRAVVAGWFGGLSHGSPSVQMVIGSDEPSCR